MDNHKKSYTLEFKAKVVLETVSGDEVNPKEVAEKYDVTPQQILLWAREMNISDENLDRLADKVGGPSPDSVELETTDKEFVRELEFGASYDKLNLKNLLYWGAFGTTFVVVIILILFQMFTYSDDRSEERRVGKECRYRSLSAMYG